MIDRRCKNCKFWTQFNNESIGMCELTMTTNNEGENLSTAVSVVVTEEYDLLELKDGYISVLITDEDFYCAQFYADDDMEYEINNNIEYN